MVGPPARRASVLRAIVVRTFLWLIAFAVFSVPSSAATPVSPGGLGAALRSAARGDTLLLSPGTHPGGDTVRVAVVLRGLPGAVVDAGHRGSALTIAAAGTRIEDLAVCGSGRDIMNTDAGVRILNATGVTLRRLVIEDVLYGIYAERATGLLVEDCRATGRVAPGDERGEGNGIHLWYCDDVRVTRSEVRNFLDAVYLSFVNGGVVEGNRLEWNGRYGLHTMYCQGNRLLGNRFALNVAGCALMFANDLEITDNDFVHNRGARTYGLLLRDCSSGTFRNNRLVDNTVAMFLDNSNRNRFEGNLIQDNGWGLLLFASCAGNVFAGNSFIQNDYPVALDMRRTSNTFDDGQSGNYWSENPAFDLDGDGLSDAPHGPVTAFAFVSKQYPDLSVLAKSPAVAALGVAERVFPALRPSEAVDRHPLVRPATRSAALDGGGIPPARPAPAAAAGFGTATLLAALALVKGSRR